MERYSCCSFVCYRPRVNPMVHSLIYLFLLFSVHLPFSPTKNKVVYVLGICQASLLLELHSAHRTKKFIEEKIIRLLNTKTKINVACIPSF